MKGSARHREHAIRVAAKLTGGVGPVDHRDRIEMPSAEAPVDWGEISLPPGKIIILSDVDGTLLRSDGAASVRTTAALSAVTERGHEVVLATGRAVRDLDRVAELTGHRGFSVCANGAAIYDHGGRTVCHTRPFPTDSDLRSVLDRLAEGVPGVILAVETLGGLRLVEGFPFPARAATPAEITPLECLRGHDVLQVLAWHPLLKAAAIADAVAAVAGDLGEVSWGNDLGVVEITAPGVDKATTAARLVNSMGTDSRFVVAFGDMPNDLPMLRWAAFPFAMANAHPSVLSAVRCHAPGNNRDGVAVVLESLFGLGGRIG